MKVFIIHPQIFLIESRIKECIIDKYQAVRLSQWISFIKSFSASFLCLYWVFTVRTEGNRKYRFFKHHEFFISRQQDENWPPFTYLLSVAFSESSGSKPFYVQESLIKVQKTCSKICLVPFKIRNIPAYFRKIFYRYLIQD